MSKKESSSKATIWSAVIGGIFVICAAFIGVIGPGIFGDSQDRTQLPPQAPPTADTNQPDTQAPPTNTPTPTNTPMPLGVQTVRVEDPRAAGPTRGFFTTKGYIIAFVNPGATDVSVVWNSDGREWQGQAQVVERQGYVPEEITLLKLTDINPPQVLLPIRLSSSLKPGDLVERYITPQDTTPGTVLEVSVQREIKTGTDKTTTVNRALITTNISTFSDAGAPVLDMEGNVVGMVYGASQKETISIPIDLIKSSFSQAFP